MAVVNKSEIIDGGVERLRLDKAIDKIPNQISDTLIPVVEFKEVPKYLEIGNSIANENSKTFTVPKGFKWRVQYGYVQLTTTATVGNRQVRLTIIDPDGNTVFLLKAKNFQIASQTEIYTIHPTERNGEEPVTGHHYFGCPPSVVIPEGWGLKIFDGLDASATDDFVMRILVEQTTMNE